MTKVFTFPLCFSLTIFAIKTGPIKVCYILIYFLVSKESKILFASLEFFKCTAILEISNLNKIFPLFNVLLIGVTNFMLISPHCYDTIVI